MMCQYRFISCNEYTTLVWNGGNAGSYACVDSEGIWELSVSSSQFAVSLKLLKNNPV